ncbi:MAG: Fur family transcriptional regulator [Candidatus Woykebacteria bacterium]
MKREVLELLKENKVKITNEREVIIEILQQTTKPLSPADIFLRVRPQLPKVNLTTIYRNLEMLEGLGLIKRVGFNKEYFSYELLANRPHHHHAICKNCGKIEDLENISEKFVDQVSRQTSFKIEDHNLEFFGYCKNCRRENL